MSSEVTLTGRVFGSHDRVTRGRRERFRRPFFLIFVADGLISYTARVERVPELFLDMVRTDPLFAAEGMDLERGEAMLDGTEEVARAYEDVLGGSILRRIFLTVLPLSRTAFPVPFLRSFIECERRRRRFLARPTMSTALNLMESWDAAQKQFSKSASRLRRFYLAVQAFCRVTDMIFSRKDKHGNILTPEDIDRQLGSLQLNAHALARAVKERRDFLLGAGGIPRDSKPDIALHYTEGSLPEKYARMHELGLLHATPFRHGVILEEHGPLLYTLSNFDDRPTAHNFKLYVVQDNKHGVTRLEVVVLDTYLFFKISTKPEDVRLRNHQALADNGISYWYQAAAKLYTTRDQTYWADIATIVDARRRPYLDQNLVQAQKSSLLDLLLGSCLGEHWQGLEHFKEFVERGAFNSNHVWRHLLNRSYPSIGFLTFNKSVWRLSERPHFLGSRRAGPQEMVYKSADEILTILSSEELERVMQGGRIREEARRAKDYGL